jgi:RNA polymerase sigma-70 factor (ECF subfamily)
MVEEAVQADDRQLIEETLAGRSEAFGLLIRRHRGALFDLVLRVTGNRDEAEDVLQQVFIDAYRHLAEFRHGSQFFTWLYSIALNRARNHLRQRKTRKNVSLDGLMPGPDKASVFHLPDSLPLPEKLVERKMELDWIVREIDHLPKEYRPIFILHYFHNLSLVEVARRVGRPLGTVKVYLHRARKELLGARERKKL